MPTITIGLVWLAMTVAFEFLFGDYVAGHSWDRLLHDYNLFAGRLGSRPGLGHGGALSLLSPARIDSAFRLFENRPQSTP